MNAIFWTIVIAICGWIVAMFINIIARRIDIRVEWLLGCAAVITKLRSEKLNLPQRAVLLNELAMRIEMAGTQEEIEFLRNNQEDIMSNGVHLHKLIDMIRNHARRLLLIKQISSEVSYFRIDECPSKSDD